MCHESSNQRSGYIPDKTYFKTKAIRQKTFYNNEVSIHRSANNCKHMCNRSLRHMNQKQGDWWVQSHVQITSATQEAKSQL